MNKQNEKLLVEKVIRPLVKKVLKENNKISKFKFTIDPSYEDRIILSTVYSNQTKRIISLERGEWIELRKMINKMIG